jgi:hypothetical protein
MMDNQLGIGGTEVKIDAFESIQDIPNNRVLMAEKLTAQAPVKPEIVEGITNVEQVFEHYKPKVDMVFETEDGGMRKETLHFRNLGDFGVKGITAQSDFLNDLNVQQEQYLKIIKQFKTNKMLKAAMANQGTKQHLIDVLQSLIDEMKENKA